MNAHQLQLLSISDDLAPSWAHEGSACGSCADGRMIMMHPSEACGCHEKMCICLAEGYAKCDCCGSLQQVWPREMLVAWEPAEDSGVA